MLQAEVSAVIAQQLPNGEMVVQFRFQVLVDVLSKEHGHDWLEKEQLPRFSLHRSARVRSHEDDANYMSSRDRGASRDGSLFCFHILIVGKFVARRSIVNSFAVVCHSLRSSLASLVSERGGRDTLRAKPTV